MLKIASLPTNILRSERGVTHGSNPLLIGFLSFKTELQRLWKQDTV
jgi:hypothetical protein